MKGKKTLGIASEPGMGVSPVEESVGAAPDAAGEIFLSCGKKS